MVQLTPHKWQIETQNGSVMQTGITAHSVSEAVDYVNRYISSFNGWNYEIVLLETEEIIKIEETE